MNFDAIFTFQAAQECLTLFRQNDSINTYWWDSFKLLETKTSFLLNEF